MSAALMSGAALSILLMGSNPCINSSSFVGEILIAPVEQIQASI